MSTHMKAYLKAEDASTYNDFVTLCCKNIQSRAKEGSKRVLTVTPSSPVVAPCCLCRVVSRGSEWLKVVVVLQPAQGKLTWFIRTSNVSGMICTAGRMLRGAVTSRNMSACEAKCAW